MPQKRKINVPSPRKVISTNRPGWITFFGWLFIVFGVISIVVSIFYAVIVGLLGSTFNGLGLGAFTGILIVIAVLVLVIGGGLGVLQIFVGKGILDLKNWARITLIVLLAISIFFSVIGLVFTIMTMGMGNISEGSIVSITGMQAMSDGVFSGSSVGSIVVGIIHLIIISLILWYFCRPNIVKLFKH